MLLINFVRGNLPQIIIVGGIFVFLQLIKSAPYVNLIPNLQSIIISFTILSALLFFRILVSNTTIILIVLTLFVIAAIVAILDLKNIEELFGFVIFILLAITLRQVVRERKEFKKETKD